MTTSPSEDEAALKVKANQAGAEVADTGNTPVKKAAEKPKSPFWLTALIQDCRVVTAQETASAKCYLKIHWQDPDFPQKIRDEKRSLINGEGAEQSKDLDLEKLAVDLEKGDLVYGMVDAAPDSFPVNIKEIFLNQISSERIDSLCWTQYDKEKGVVSVQIVMKVTVHAPMSLKRYPYDRHVVPFCVGTRKTKVTKWELSKEWPEWAPFNFKQDKTMLLENQTTPDLEYRHKRCFPYLGGEKPILCVRIERQPVNIMKRIALPVFIVVSIALAVSGIKDSSYQDEYGAALISLLTLTAFSYTVQPSLPKLPRLPYLTLADCYFLLGYSLHLVIVLKILMASQICLDTSDNSNRSFVLGDTVCQDRNHWLTTVLAIMWALLHVMLFLSTMLPLHVNKYVRVPYKKLVEDYAEEFFSKPVPCPMGEGIDKLAKIDTDDQMQEKEEKKEKKAGEKGKEGRPTTSSSSSA